MRDSTLVDPDDPSIKATDPPPLLDPHFYAGDPYPTYARLREESPLYWYEEGHFWVASSYENVIAVSRDSERFSSAEAVTISDHEDKPRPRNALIYMDAPPHRRARKLVQTGFSAGVVRGFEGHIRRITRSLLDGLAPGDPFDFVEGPNAANRCSTEHVFAVAGPDGGYNKLSLEEL